MMTFSLEEFKIKQYSLPISFDCGHLVHHKFHTKWLFCILKSYGKNKMPPGGLATSLTTKHETTAAM